MTRTPQETFDLATEIGRLNIFGPWKSSLDGRKWCRPEPNIPTSDSRVQLWFEDDIGSGREKGWYFRLGFGVVGIGGISSTRPLTTADEAKAIIDADLLACLNTVVVMGDPTP